MANSAGAVLYLHGFRSSPKSFKARMIAEKMQEAGRGSDYLCPQLPASPREAIELALQLAHGVAPDRLTLIGSSLGGFYANWLAEQLGCRAVLLNPAVRPWRGLQQHVGITTAFHSDERFEFRTEHVDELKLFDVRAITRPERYFLVAATGDEVLDWHEMVEQYPGATHKVIEGSDHGLSDFSVYLDEVTAFCTVDPEGAA